MQILYFTITILIYFFLLLVCLKVIKLLTKKMSSDLRKVSNELFWPFFFLIFVVSFRLFDYLPFSPKIINSEDSLGFRQFLLITAVSFIGVRILSLCIFDLYVGKIRRIIIPPIFPLILNKVLYALIFLGYLHFVFVRIPAKTATYSGNKFTTYSLIQVPRLVQYQSGRFASILGVRFP